MKNKKLEKLVNNKLVTHLSFVFLLVVFVLALHTLTILKSERTSFAKVPLLYTY